MLAAAALVDQHPLGTWAVAVETWMWLLNDNPTSGRQTAPTTHCLHFIRTRSSLDIHFTVHPKAVFIALQLKGIEASLRVRGGESGDRRTKLKLKCSERPVGFVLSSGEEGRLHLLFFKGAEKDTLPPLGLGIVATADGRFDWKKEGAVMS